MRLFVAMQFPTEVKAAISEVRDRVRKAALRGNFTFDENLHLTLAFLGECDFQQVETVKAVMDDIVFSEFKLMLDKVGCFKREGGNTWWIGLKESDHLSCLQEDLSNRLREKGFVLENRKYTPHVTLGREVKLPAGFVHPQAHQITFSVSCIELMKSERINGKLVYTPIYSKNNL